MQVNDRSSALRPKMSEERKKSELAKNSFQVQPKSICYHLNYLEMCIYVCKTTINYIINVAAEGQILCF